MTDNDIIKALECCANLEACEGCPMSSLDKYDTDSCERQIMLYALDLINRQKAEIQAQRENIHNRKAEANRLNSKIRSLKAEIERLQKAGEEAVSCFNRMEGLYNIKCMELKVATNQAITEFAERLKKYYNRLDNSQGNLISFHIDQIAKEMKGERE